ncbi:MAG: FHA domain-containing protein, partial [Micromonosporaceae bacterium]
MTGALLIGAPDGERWITPEEGSVRIGRDPLCRIVVDDVRVSREHLEVSYGSGRWWLRDLGSRNGTYAASGQVSELDLSQQCEVRLGALDGPVLNFRPQQPPAAPAPLPYQPPPTAVAGGDGPLPVPPGFT